MIAPIGDDVRVRLRRLQAAGGLALPFPAGGRTAQRHVQLYELARRESVSVARLAEGHADALAVLAEADRSPVPGSLYGVWASESSAGALSLTADGRLDGVKPFCSGLGIVDRALVTVNGLDGVDLLDLDVHAGEAVRHDLSAWQTEALAATATGTMHVHGRRVDLAEARIGDGRADWYLRRTGFWHGACGPASCWAGAAAALVDTAEGLCDADPHRRAHLGALRSAAWSMRALLDVAGRQIDDAPDDRAAAQGRALAVRHQIERRSTEVLDRFGRAFGPRPLAGDPAVAQRVQDLGLYLRQCHNERDDDEAGGLPAWT